jgi:hypothetical protein
VGGVGLGWFGEPAEDDVARIAERTGLAREEVEAAIRRLQAAGRWTAIPGALRDDAAPSAVRAVRGRLEPLNGR